MSDKATVWMQTDGSPCPSPHLPMLDHTISASSHFPPPLLRVNLIFYFIGKKKSKPSNQTSSTFCLQTCKITCSLGVFLLPLTKAGRRGPGTGSGCWSPCKSENTAPLLKNMEKFQADNHREQNQRISLTWAQRGPWAAARPAHTWAGAASLLRSSFFIIQDPIHFCISSVLVIISKLLTSSDFPLSPGSFISSSHCHLQTDNGLHLLVFLLPFKIYLWLSPIKIWVLSKSSGASLKRNLIDYSVL